MSIKKALKNFGMSCILAPMIIYNINAQSVSQEKKTAFITPYCNIDLANFSGNFPGLSISNVPLNIRNVPMHPNDNYNPNNIAPIPDTKLFSHHGYYNTGLSAGLNFGDHIQIGALMNYIIKRTPQADDGNTDWDDKRFVARRNYATSNPNAQRTAGTAFTYYGNLTEASKDMSEFEYGLEGILKFNLHQTGSLAILKYN